MYIYGKNVAKEKLSTDERINRVYLSNKFNDSDILNLINKKHIKYSIISDKELNMKVNGLHQGIILDVDDVEAYDLNYLNKINSKNPVIVMLDHLEDPHNFGAIIRSCEAFGVSAIIIPNDRSVTINSTVVKTSAGAIYNMPIIRVANLGATITKLKKLGYWIVGTDMNGTNYREIDYNCPTCLIIGNEGKGMAKTIEDSCDYIATIPMSGKINSLNASVACAIVIAEIFGGRN